MFEILAVAGLFLLRVGLPLVALIVLGLLVDRWQTRRNEEIKRQLEKRPLDFTAYKADGEDYRKAA